MIKTEVTKKLAASLKEAGVTVTEETKYFVVTAGNEPAPAPKPKPKRKKKRKEQWYSDTEVLIMPKIRKVAAEKSNSIAHVLARDFQDYVGQSRTLGSIRDDALKDHGFTHQQLSSPLITLRERGCLREVAK
tara:strand:+ start:610 stop:1005 length:396 start_codon:yes stop_codon:yes gene_type:complete